MRLKQNFARVFFPIQLARIPLSRSFDRTYLADYLCCTVMPALYCNSYDRSRFLHFFRSSKARVCTECFPLWYGVPSLLLLAAVHPGVKLSSDFYATETPTRSGGGRGGHCSSGEFGCNLTYCPVETGGQYTQGTCGSGSRAHGELSQLKQRIHR